MRGAAGGYCHMTPDLADTGDWSIDWKSWLKWEMIRHSMLNLFKA